MEGIDDGGDNPLNVKFVGLSAFTDVATYIFPKAA
jgi:hypothetical protein